MEETGLSVVFFHSTLQSQQSYWKLAYYQQNASYLLTQELKDTRMGKKILFTPVYNIITITSPFYIV